MKMVFKESIDIKLDNFHQIREEIKMNNEQGLEQQKIGETDMGCEQTSQTTEYIQDSKDVDNKKMKKCSVCGCVVSKTAKTCPKCGHVLKRKGKGCLVVLLCPVILIAIISIIGMISRNVKNSNGADDETTTTFIVTATEEQYESISFPQTVRTDCFEIYVEGVYTSKEIRPKRTNGVYNYKSAESGKQYCYIKGTIKNIAGTSHQISVSGDFNFDDTYSYTGLLLKDVENGVDIVTMYETIQPLETVDFYYACCVPDELINNYYSSEVKLDVSTDLFDSSCDTLYNKYCVSFNN